MSSMMAAACKEGKLSKYTNVMKGWQNRYFVLNPASGVLEYHINQNEVTIHQSKPRGSLQLDGAVIAPSQEDSCTFTVNASNGEVYKLRAINAKERQDWVARLRSVSEYCTSQLAEDHPPLSARKPRTKSLVSNFNKFKDQVQQLSGPPSSSSSQHKLSSSCNDFRGRSGSHSSMSRVLPVDIRNLTKPDDKSELKESWESLMSADNYLAGLMSQLENLPFSADEVATSSDSNTVGYTDKDVVLMRCISSATLQSLTNAYAELNRFKQQADSILPPGAHVAWVKKSSNESSGGNDEVISASSTLQDCTPNSKQPSIVVVPLLANPSDEVRDDDTIDSKEDNDAVEENKNVIVHLISQLKLGMDLTKVTLPTFILEKRSLLEMYADFNSSTNLLCDVIKGTTPLERMNNVLKYYLTTFHAGRRGTYSKKPYNPVLGEIFQCSYYVPRDDVTTANTSSLPPTDGHHRVRFIAEQVSHHPPISAMHLCCQELDIQMTSHIWTKSKFMNMSVGVSNIGEGVLSLGTHGEEYVVTYPSAYARSLLTEPWSELTGRCTITCQQSGLLANIVFHTKPAYGGDPHKVSAEVKRTDDGSVLTKVTGKWNHKLNFVYIEDEEQRSETVDVTLLPTFPKYIRPMEKQEDSESRKFWFPVTKALKDGQMKSAAECKWKIEEEQRQLMKDGGDVKISAYFTKQDGDNHKAYVFKQSATSN